MEIVAIDMGGTVDTVQFNMVDRFQRWRAVDVQTTEALRLLRQGISEQDPVLVGRGATISADASQIVLSKPRLSEVKEFAESVDAVGINVGHSGTIMGVLLDARKKRGASTYPRGQGDLPGRSRGVPFPINWRWCSAGNHLICQKLINTIKTKGSKWLSIKLQ
ncbi:MAG: hypothetical protein Ct9H300mP11_25610 [Chloroflexota bacterium]|nr:MAG: hypothetical protein Ct9H300mP11_25610 [Chloroflexota bacterium]